MNGSLFWLCAFLSLMLLGTGCTDKSADGAFPNQAAIGNPKGCLACHEAKLDTAFLSTAHGRAGCPVCHEGDVHASTQEAAHTGYVRNPAAQPLTFCLGCHSNPCSEAQGLLANTQKDAHAQEGRTCLSCHTDAGHHTAADERPSCLSCHAQDKDTDNNNWHAMHWPDDNAGANKLACGVCHGQPYVNRSEGLSFIGFKIAQAQTPGVEFETVRHLPASLAGNGPTWKPTVLHNMVRNAPQAGSADNCSDNCHGSSYLLQARDFNGTNGVNASELNANRSILADDD